MRLQDVLSARAKIVTGMRTLTGKAEAESRDLTDDEAKQFDTLKAQLATADKNLERAQVVADAERRMAVDPTQPRRGLDGSFEDSCRRFSVTRAVAAMITPGQVDGGLEAEISAELARRSGRKPRGILVPHEIFQERRTIMAGETGGFLYPETVRGDLFIDILRRVLRVLQLGATVLSGLVGDQLIPKLTASATGQWIPENGALTEADQTFGQIAMRPRTVGAMVSYSRQMLANSNPSIEALVRNDLARVLAEAIDLAAIAGNGVTQPLGVLNTDGIGDVSMSGGPTWATVLAVIAEVEKASALAGAPGWLTRPEAVKKMRATTKETGDAAGGYVQMDPNALAGYPLFTSAQVPLASASTTSLIFGNWADLLIGYWSAVDILPNPYHSDVYAKGGVLINALQDADVAVRHPESFAASQDLSFT